MSNAEQKRFRLVVFDWDGTLADSASIIVRAIQQACRDLELPVPDDAQSRYVIGLGLHDAIRHVAPDLHEDDYGKYSARYREHYLARDFDIPLFAGVPEMLDELAARGYLLGVATGKSRAGLDRSLAQTGLQTRFDATRCADEGFPKPHPDMLLTLMHQLAAEPQETLMIGDTTHDLELANNAKTAAVAVTYGAHTPAELDALRPLASVDSVTALRLWLTRHG
jgi:phosphoglycolate phosphatase